jgi:gliding motility-associated-like protein
VNLGVYLPTPVSNPLADTILCIHEANVITIDYNGRDYQWNTGAFGPSIIPDYNGDYIVNFVENGTNCLLSDTINITIEDCIGNCVVLAPTGFSPNENGTNDIFRAVTTCDEGFSSFAFSIYNRWGELIYFTDNWREGWDGTYKGREAEIGTYIYYVEYIKALTNKKESLSGNITLIR